MSSMVRSIKRANARKNGTFIPQKPLREKGNRSFIDVIMSTMRMKKLTKTMSKDSNK